MGDSQFCLKWNDFENKIMSEFEALKHDEDFVDVTLSCHGQSIKAHKIVLSACSPYLKNIFKEHPGKHALVIFDNLSFQDLESLIAFIYTGQVYVAQTELTSFLEAAKALQIKGLEDHLCLDSLIQNDLAPTENDSKSTENGAFSRKSKFNWNLECKEEELPSKKNVGATLPQFSLHANDNDAYKLSRTENKEWSSNDTCNPYVERDLRNLNPSNDINYCETKVANLSKKVQSLDRRPCHLCNKVYSNRSNLRQHMRLIHNPTVVTCRICCKVFKTDLYLRRHLSSYHGDVNDGVQKSFTFDL